MAVPKRKVSPANTRKRRSQWLSGAKPPNLVPITVDGKTKLVPRELLRHFHRG
ncbi:LSU ribosomal protein L32P [Tamaricihabitans halophyticus]|uniref:Large ribosomal subunit protein bL32 n=1 Tax=Tamaricihabitans halophyticus TaxID=1262583 RepID=A0A4V2SUP5_9PSEU|nr:50S ribosomal protein L32 [Tamaricihabitans halophyticus]TCP55316.1 LSU ribosomal protein L32P [Tamaricihabitans halophyticus]